MVGSVIDGKYAGCGIHKLADKNVLYIQIDDFNKIALSQKNVKWFCQMNRHLLALRTIFKMDPYIFLHG